MSGKIWTMKGGWRYEYPDIDTIISPIRCAFYLHHCTFRVSESAWISGRGDHAAGRDLGGKGRDQLVILISVGAGLTGSWALYLLGRLGGSKVLGFYFKKFPKQRPLIEDKMDMLRKKGGIGVFVSKLLPMVRTLISIPAGMVRMNFMIYTVSSVLGIFLWNLVFVGAGYFFGEAAIQALA